MKILRFQLYLSEYTENKQHKDIKNPDARLHREFFYSILMQDDTPIEVPMAVRIAINS